jgi:lantibiotic modifying enzyme
LKPADHLLAFASVCGRRLLELRSPASQGFRVWPIDGQLLTGLSYGAAGIAYALSLLAAAIGDTEFRDAAAEACAYERSVYSVEEGNWPDFRGSSETTPFATKWCHGGPGIALCRIGGLAVLDTGEIRADIEAGLRVTLSAPPTPSDIVCCGEMGRAEVLLFAAERLGRPDLREAAERTAARTMASAQAAGGYRTIPNAGPCHADFHRGLAGIGYGLLRLAATHPLPCVLAWE